MVKQYRVWRMNSGKDQRATQGHYIIAKSKKEAIDAVRRKGFERPDEFGAILWKHGKDWVSMKGTAKAKCFIETGDIHCKARRK